MQRMGIDDGRNKRGGRLKDNLDEITLDFGDDYFAERSVETVGGVKSISKNDGGEAWAALENEVVGMGVDRKSFSGPLSGPLNKRGRRRSPSFNIPDRADQGGKSEDDYVEITLDIGDDSVAVHSVNASRVDMKNPKLSLLAKGFEKRPFGSSLVRNASARIRLVSEELKRFTSSTKQPEGRLDRTKFAASHALKELNFITKNGGGAAAWAALDNLFDDLTVETNGLLHRSLFGECIGMNKDSKEFAGKLFDSLSRRTHIVSNSITKGQLREFWDQIVDESFDSRLQTFFDMVDKDSDGRITEDDVREIISTSASANKLSNIQTQADEYAALIMEELDPDNLGYIMIENLEMLLLQAPAHIVRGESMNLSHMLNQKLKTTYHGNRLQRWYEDFRYFLFDNWKRCWVIVLWIMVMVGLFIWKYFQYKNRYVYKLLGPCVCIAKGAAETLKLNMAIILLPVCRNTITWLRNKTRLGVVVPFDDNLNFHKVIALAIICGVGIHAVSHLTCYFPRIIHATKEEYAPLEQFFGEQAKNYWHFIKEPEGYTGIIMVVLMTIAFTLATPWLRRGKLNLPSFLKKLTGFNAFWYSHHLFVIVYTLLIVHGIKIYLAKEWYKKTTWMYLAVPIFLYAWERLIRAFRSSVKPVKILKVAVYPGNVLALHMSKLLGFKYKSGQYMFINCANVSHFEWHPFYITSAPGDDYLSVHIRTLGDWTRQLKNVFSEVCQPPPNGKLGLLRAESQGHYPNFPRVLIDGPYGAPAQDYKKYDVVLLVGLGIGATPMISIVKDIVNNMRAKEEQNNILENGGTLQKTKSGSANNFKTTRAYFYWVTREQGSFDWFKGVMNEAAEMDNNGVIEMHNYCTSVYEEGDVRSALITMLQSLNHAKNGVDVVSGTRVKSHFGKPNWRNVYRQIALNHTGSRIGVFYCGAPALTKELKQLALDFSHKTSTKFDFHKEIF